MKSFVSNAKRPLFAFYQHLSYDLKLKQPPVEHVPWSKAYKPLRVALDLTG